MSENRYRELFSPTTLREVVSVQLPKELNERILKHGNGVFVSPHETYGVLAEEMGELLEAIRANDGGEIRAELYDVAIGAIWGIVSTYGGVAPEIESETIRQLKARIAALNDELRFNLR
jgi:hypothetical protein